MNGKSDQVAGLATCGRTSDCLSKSMFDQVGQHFMGTTKLDESLVDEITSHVVSCSSCAGQLEQLPVVKEALVRMMIDEESIHTSEPPSTWPGQVAYALTHLPRVNYATIS